MPAYDPPGPDELLYRRISLRANPAQLAPDDRTVLQQAFLPHKRQDVDGLSVIRADYRTAEEVACPANSPHRNYVVAVVRAGDLMDLDLSLDVTPDEIDRLRGGTPAHVSIREMNAMCYRDEIVLDRARRIAEYLVKELLGPFP